MSPGKPISFQPARFRLPPYSGLAYRPSMVCSNSRLVKSLTDGMARILSCCAGAFREIAAGQLVEFADSLRVLGLPPGEALAPGDLGHRVERGEPGHPVGSR